MAGLLLTAAAAYAQPVPPPALLDARLEQGRDAPAEAAALYLALLAQAAPGLPAADAAALRRHAAALRPLLPPAVAALVFADSGAARWAFREGAGAHLVRWWQRQDPLPATPANERVVEHRQRVAWARAHYGDPEAPAGYDDRGEVYVRLGPPPDVRHIRFNEGAFFRDVFRFGVPAGPADFPENELWRYPQLGEAAYFVFVREQGRYRRADPLELIPPSLRGRGDLSRAVSALAAVRYVYGHLAQFHPDFATVYAQVEAYAQWQEQEQLAAETGSPRTTGQQQVVVGRGGTGQIETVHGNRILSVELPDVFLQRLAAELVALDERARRRRATEVPASHSRGVPEAQRFLLASRAARFLDADGTTRTELFWSPLPGALPTGSQAWLLTAYPVAYGSLYQPRRLDSLSFVIQRSGAADAVIPAQQTTFPGGVGQYHVALQLDLYEARLLGSAGPVRRAALRRRTVARWDSLQALHAAPDRLEMSDLVPLLVRPGADALLYPFPYLPEQATLQLAFEVYHLAADGAGQARYAIAYEVVRRDGGGRFLRSPRRTSRGVEAVYTGPAPTAREQVTIDLHDLGQARTVEVVVRVRDEATGRTAERRIIFDQGA